MRARTTHWIPHGAAAGRGGVERARRVARPARWRALVAASLLLAACGDSTSGDQQEATTGDAGRDEVVATLSSYYDAFTAREWQLFAEHFWPGATLTTIWQPPDADSPDVVTMTIDEFVARAPAGPGSREIFEERMTGAEVRVRGNLAQAWAHYTARFGDPGRVMEWSGVDAFTLMKHEDRWKIVSLAYESDR